MLSNLPRFPALCRLCHKNKRQLLLFVALTLTLSSGCTSPSEYFDNGLKVGPNYQKPPAPVASEWIDSKAQGVSVVSKDLKEWWAEFNDPKLNALVAEAYQQNLTLRSAGTRILAARAQRNIAAGNLFPQTQQVTGDYNRNAASANIANPKTTRFYNDISVGANLSWELDFWG